MRSTSARVSVRSGPGGKVLRIFIEQSVRRLAKPECISALTDRASARSRESLGQSCAWGNFSCRVSQMARESQMVVSPSISAATRPLGEYLRICCAVSGRSRPITTSSNGAPVSLRASQGRIDHDEYCLFPITIFSMASRSGSLG